MQAALGDAGWTVSRRRVARLMAAAGLRAKAVSGYRAEAAMHQRYACHPNVLWETTVTSRRAGTEASLPPNLFRSHIDSVPKGGNFDGDLGSLSVLSVLETLASGRVRTRHPLEMVIRANDEQGATLDREGIPVGIVERIVAIRRHEVVITVRRTSRALRWLVPLPHRLSQMSLAERMQRLRTRPATRHHEIGRFAYGEH